VSDAQFNIDLLEWQRKVWDDPTRFRVIAAGRRTGKSRLAALTLIFKALQCPSRTAKVFYVAPTQGQARDIMWDLLQELAPGLIASTHVNNLTVTLVNGVTIALKGADRPQTMRGVSLWFVVLDEYADIKADVWETILLPALSDHDGDAMFIGTPMGRNHFYELYKDAELGTDPDYSAYHFTSYDNPYIKREVIERAKQSMSSHNFRQEYMASFEAQGSSLFEESWIKYEDEEPHQGSFFIAVDPAGFEGHKKKQTKNTRLDETAISVVKVNADGWWVAEIIHGRWTLDETATRIFRAVEKYKPTSVGIERGIAQQALLSPLQDMMRRKQRFFRIDMLSHRNQSKTDRVVWALQGRFENGFIRLATGDWNLPFLDQLFQFPNPLTHDDLIDSLAYIDQLAIEGYYDTESWEDDDYEPLDPDTGY
jgi:predicted phage terminase large subunit-like protein